MTSKASEASAGLPVRQGAPPTVTHGVPHIQRDQTSDPEVYRRLIARAFADARITKAPSRASLPGALTLMVAAGRAVRQGSMIVDREFAHIHHQPGAGSIHHKLPASEAADVVAKAWGEWHPFALSGSAPGMVVVFSPRNDSDLQVGRPSSAPRCSTRLRRHLGRRSDTCVRRRPGKARLRWQARDDPHPRWSDPTQAITDMRTDEMPVAESPLPIWKPGENPRTTRVRKVVIEAATTLFCEQGYRAVTPQRVSQETGVARSTIYRHWPDQQALLLDTIDAIMFSHHTLELTGDLGADLETALHGLRLRFDRRPFREFFAPLLDHANRSREIVPAQRRFVEGVLAPIREVIDAAVEHDGLELSVSPEEAVAQLTGPLFHQHVMLRARITDELIAASVDGFLSTQERRAVREG